MLEDQDVAEEAEEESPLTPARRPSPRDLHLIRTWRRDADPKVVEQADLTAALNYLPTEEQHKAEGEVRHALRFYLATRQSAQRPRPDELARYFRTLEAATRTLRRVLLARPET